MEVDVGEESKSSEGWIGVGNSDKSTPIIGRNEKEGRYLARKAVEGSTRARYGKLLPVRNEAEDSSRILIPKLVRSKERRS
jgi:hypothetical protein